MAASRTAQHAAWTGLVGPNGDPLRSEPIASARGPAEFDLHADYDVVTNRYRDDHWRYAHNLAAFALDSPQKLQTIRNFSRYEFRNNNYARGIVLKTVQETIGTGPRLQIDPSADSNEARKAAKQFEMNWQEWADESKFVERIITSVTEYFVGGESFNIFSPNAALRTVPVQLEVFEAEQFSTPWLNPYFGANHEYRPVDGIEFDRYGNPQTYHRLRYHPGGDYRSMGYSDVDYVDASVCVHLFRKERPTSFRGVSHLAPSLPLFALLRRYLEATTKTAEVQARIAGSMRTSMNIEECDNVGTVPIEFAIGDGIFTNLPRGWQLDPFKANQPAQGIAEFVSVIKHEINSNWMIPWNVATSDSSDYNFASGRLDHITFYSMVRTIRAWLKRELLDRFFSFWFDFANLANFVPSRLGTFTHRWHWDEREPIDEEKEARAIKAKRDAGVFDEETYFRERVGADATEVAERQAKLAKYKQDLADKYKIRTEFNPFGIDSQAIAMERAGRPDSQPTDNEQETDEQENAQQEA